MKMSRWKKISVVAAVTIGVVVIAAVIIIPHLLDLNRYRGFIVSQVEEAIGGEFQIGHISWSIADDIELEIRDVSIKGASAFSVDVKLPYVHAEISMFSILQKKVKIKALSVERPSVKVFLHPIPDDTSTEDKNRQQGNPLPVEITVDTLAMQQGRVTLEDSVTLPGRTSVRVFTDVEVEAFNVRPNDEIRFKVALRDEAEPGIGAITAEGAFKGLTESFTILDPTFKINATISSMNVESIKPYLEDYPRIHHMGGHVSIEVNCLGDLNKDVQVGGFIDLSRFKFEDPTLFDRPLPGVDTKIAYQVSFDPNRIDIQKLAVTLGEISLTTSAQIEGWLKSPIIKHVAVSSRLPLPALSPFIPWKRIGGDSNILRHVLETGGKLTIDKGFLPDIDVSNPPESVDSFLREIKLNAKLSDLTVPKTKGFPEVDTINGSVRLDNGSLEIENLTASIASIQLPKINASINHIFDRPIISADVRGSIQVPVSGNAAVDQWLKGIGIEKLSGAADVDMKLKMDPHNSGNFQLEGKSSLKKVSIKTVFSTAFLDALDADVTIDPETVEILNCSTTLSLPSGGKPAGGEVNIEFAGKVDQWRRNPLLTLHRFKSSSISLPELASVIPLKQTGTPTKSIRESLSTGGRVSVLNLVFSKLDTKKLKEDTQTLFSTLKADLSFSDLNLQIDESFPRFETLSGRLNLEKNVLTVKGLKGRLEHLTLPTIDMQITDVFNKPKVSLKAKGPMQLEAGKQDRVRKLLRENGLNRFSGAVAVDLGVHYDYAKPKEWESSGFIDLKGIHAETYPAGVRLENLKGRVSLQRKQSIDLQIKNLTARVEGAPIRVDGRVTGGGTPQMIIDTKVQTSQMDLSHIADLVPLLEKMKLRGMLDMDMDIYYPLADPASTRLSGRMVTRDVAVKLEKSGLVVTGGNCELELSGKSLSIKNMAIRINEQPVVIDGRLINQPLPNATLRLKSSGLNIDRLLADFRKQRSTTSASLSAVNQNKKVSRKSSLPHFLKNSAIKLEALIENGRYNKQPFKNLVLTADYRKGVLKRYDFDVHVADGRIQANGLVDLRNLSNILIEVNPKISNVPSGYMAAVFGISNLSFKGPLSISGSVRCKTGGSAGLVGSINGHIEGEVGRGHVTHVGPAGSVLLKLLTLADIRAYFSRTVLDDLTSKGIPFNQIRTGLSVKDGMMNIESFQFEGSALNVQAQGKVALLEQQLDMDVNLEPLGTLDKLLERVPIAGSTGKSLTKIYTKVEGDIEHPKIKIKPAKGVTEGVKEATKASGKIVEKAIRAPGKSVKGVLDYLKRGLKQKKD